MPPPSKIPQKEGCILDRGTVPPACLSSGGTVPPVVISNQGTVPPLNLFPEDDSKKYVSIAEKVCQWQFKGTCG